MEYRPEDVFWNIAEKDKEIVCMNKGLVDLENKSNQISKENTKNVMEATCGEIMVEKFSEKLKIQFHRDLTFQKTNKF